MRHKHYEAIIAFAEGKQIQWQPPGGWRWVDCCSRPMFDDTKNYRIKPEPKKLQYRVALFKYPNGDYESALLRDERQIEAWKKSIYFVRWLTEWIEVEIEE